MRTLAVSILALSGVCAASIASARTFEFTYEIHPGDFPSSQSVDIYLPLPATAPGQQVSDMHIDALLPGRKVTEERYGNTYYHLHRPAGNDTPLRATLRWTVERDSVGSNPVPLPEAERQLFLAPNTRVPVGHPILEPILADIRAARVDDTPQATARAIYDWVVDNVEYKKVGTGWGNGDTFWACSERYGNCTDFHALLISLARTEGIPARFDIGFPIPMDQSAGVIGGYHCWVQVYLPGQGWLPLDASEAAKHPEQREFLYGNQAPDRVGFTTGRDLVVSAATARQPLNYFIYPHVEVNGAVWEGKLETRFSYRELDDSRVAKK